MQHRQKHSMSPPLIQKNHPPSRNNNADKREQLYDDERRLLERLDFEKTFDVKSLNLNKENQLIYTANPHLREVFINKQQIIVHEKEFTITNRFLKLQSERSSDKPYSSRNISTTEYWGQRKLLLTEIEFLTNYGAGAKFIVLYAGAAPGSHINYLSSLFPHLQFVLFDANDFSATQTDKIKIRSEKFTDNVANSCCVSEYPILFICNVRTFDPNNQIDNDMIHDMHHQMGWHRIIKPRASLLNFRLPRTPGKTEYLKGDLIIEPWASKRSTECRLIVDQEHTLIDYDHMEFENALLDFHNEKRIRYYKHNIDEIKNEGLDHCYDCRAEIFILQEYLTKSNKVKSETELKTETAAMSSEISRKIVDGKRKPVLSTGVRTLGIIPKRPIILTSNMCCIF
jgi:hypothetical protein